MFRKVIYCITYRKKSSALMLLFIVIAAFVLQSVGPLFDSVSEITFEEGVDAYGRHHAVFFDLTEQQLEILYKNSRIDTLGIMHNYGVYQLADLDQVLTIGSFDITAQELGSLDIIEGTYPQAPDEIALENHLRYLPEGDPLQVGDPFRIRTQEKTLTFYISGFLQDYTGQWNSLDVLQPGVNDYPHCVVAKANLFTNVSSTNALLHIQEANKMLLPSQSILQIAVDIGISNSPKLIFNDAAYGMQQESRLYTLRQLKTLFTAVGSVGAILLLYIACMTYFKPYIEVAKTMYLVGAKHKDTFLILSIWSALLTLTGSGIGLLLSETFIASLHTHLVYMQGNKAPWLIPLALLFVTQVFAFIFFTRYIRRYYSVSWSEQVPQEAVKEIRMKKSMVIPLAKFHLRENLKRMVWMCALVAIYLTLLFCVQHHSKNTQDVIETPTITVTAAEGYGLNFYNEFELASKTQGYDIQKVNQLGDLPGVSRIRKSYYAQPASLIYPEDGDDLYYDQLMQRFSVGFWETDVEVDSIPQEYRATRDGYEIIVLDKWNLETFQAYYPDAKQLSKGEAILFCPVFQSESDIFDSVLEQGKTTNVTNTAFLAGDMLRFGMITTIDFLQTLNDPSMIQYTEESLLIKQVYNQGMQDLEVEGQTSPVISVVITEETAESLSFAKQISRFHIEMEKGLSRDVYQNIETQASRLGLTLQGARVHSYLQEKDFFDRLTNAVKAGYLAISIILISFITFSIVNILYETLLQRLRQFGILRAVGYSRVSLFGTVLLEVQVYWLIITLLTTILGLWGVRQYSTYICGPVVKGAASTALLLQICQYMLYIHGLLTFISLCITHNVFKKSISSCIRFAE